MGQKKRRPEGRPSCVGYWFLFGLVKQRLQLWDTKLILATCLNRLGQFVNPFLYIFKYNQSGYKSFTACWVKHFAIDCHVAFGDGGLNISQVEYVCVYNSLFLWVVWAERYAPPIVGYRLEMLYLSYE